MKYKMRSRNSAVCVGFHLEQTQKWGEKGFYVSSFERYAKKVECAEIIISGFELILNPARLRRRADRHDFMGSKQTKKKESKKGRIVSNDHLDPAARSAATTQTTKQKHKNQSQAKQYYSIQTTQVINHQAGTRAEHKRSSQYQLRCPHCFIVTLRYRSESSAYYIWVEKNALHSYKSKKVSPR